MLLSSVFAVRALVLYTPLRALLDVSSPTLAEWTCVGAAFVGFLALDLATSAVLDRVFAGANR